MGMGAGDADRVGHHGVAVRIGAVATVARFWGWARNQAMGGGVFRRRVVDAVRGAGLAAASAGADAVFGAHGAARAADAGGGAAAGAGPADGGVPAGAAAANGKSAWGV